MSAKIICLFGLIFAAIAIVKWLRRSDNSRNRGHISLVNNVTSNPPFWEKRPDYSPLARDRLEVLEGWEKCGDDSSLPPPIAPTKPHPYFGDESGPDKID
jgi:hypothetical protein